jgi:adenosylmethionine-8-amino-7-oxononanoate aminotransferase
MLENARTRAIQLEELLRTKLMGPNAPSKPYVADIRGGGLFWGIEFELDDAAQTKLDKSNKNSNGNRFGGVVQEIAFNNGLVIIGMSGTVDGVKGEHAILAPPLNVTPEEIEKIVDLFVNSVEEACKLLA